MAKTIPDFQQFDVMCGDFCYTSEFDLDTVKQCMAARVMDMTHDMYEFTFTVFYYSVLKNHPHTSVSTVRRFFDGFIEREGYGVDDFEPIITEFKRCVGLFTSGGKKEPAIKARANNEAVLPKK